MNYLTSSQFILNKHVKIDIYHEICRAINLCYNLKEKSFAPSNIYHKELQLNVLNDEVRSSQTQHLPYKSNQTIFRSIESLVEMINEANNTMFSLVPDEIDIVKYEKGDFFSKHSDFIPIKNKYITYYTLLFSLDANCVGGETRLYFNNQGEKLNESFTFNETITPDSWLLFKNEIEHSSNKIKSGYKIVLKANLVHINLSNNQFNSQFDKLIMAKNEIIDDFLSKNNNILPTYNLADYLFYRDCFRNRADVVPVQFIVMKGDKADLKLQYGYDVENNNTESDSNESSEDSSESEIDAENCTAFEYLDKVHEARAKSAEKEKRKLKKESKRVPNKDIIWFNIGDNCPLIYFASNMIDSGENDEFKPIFRPKKESDMSHRENYIKKLSSGQEPKMNYLDSKGAGYTGSSDSMYYKNDWGDAYDNGYDMGYSEGYHKGYDHGYNDKSNDKTRKIDSSKLKLDASFDKDAHSKPQQNGCVDGFRDGYLHGYNDGQKGEFNDKSGDDDSHNKRKYVNWIINKYVHSNSDLNEMERAISLMICYFWIAALSYDDEEGYGLQFDTDHHSADMLIAEKIDENLGKIHEQQRELFGLPKINMNLNNMKDKFNTAFINKIYDSFVGETITYHISGAYYCNETNYIDCETNVYFGFVKL